MSEWIRPDGCEGGACVEYRTDGSVVYLRSSVVPVRMIGVTRAEWDTFVAGLEAQGGAQRAAESIWSSPWPDEDDDDDRAIAAAEARGYGKAVAMLRASDRFVAWALKHPPDTGIISDVCADYLAAVAGD